MADISSSIIKSLFPSQGNKRTTFNAEEIDERILRLLGLEDIFDLDYDTYISLLKEQLVISSMGKRKIPREEEILLQEEYKKVKSKKGKGRFNPKKKITANAFRKGSAVGINLKVKSLKPGIGKGQLALPPALPSLSVIEEIKNALNDIIQQLTSLNDLFNDELEKNRITRENLRRRQREEDLEKRFDGVKKAAEKVIAPIKSILQKIIDFFLAILIGRSLILLLRWFSDEKNKDIINAIGRFLGDHWPKLLALFIAFGTGLGGFVRGLIKLIIRGTGALIKGAVGLAARAGIKGAGGALKFLGGPKGRLIGAGLEVGATALGTLALSKGIENFGGIGGGKETTPPTAKLSGGGFANFGNLFGNMGSFFNGMVSGPKGVDKVPAMLTDGEFVMSTGAVEKYGVDTLESMNAMGGGNNKPKVVGGTTYASGGGFISQASHHLRQDEALSSLTPGINDFTKPGSGNWSKVSSNTPIHSYVDSVGQPTIGWGSTFYDSILNGKKPVKKGDKINKSKADNILDINLTNLSKEYSTKMAHWNKMSDKQKAGLLIVGYNAPYGPIGAYPKLTSALQSGDIKTASQNLQRGGPNQQRIELEKKLLLSGPLNLKNLAGPKIVGEKKVGSGIPFIPPFMHKKQGGGSLGSDGKVMENTGYRNTTSSADRRFLPLAVQPGEGVNVVTKDFVDRGGMGVVKYLQALLDSDSNARKSGILSNKSRTIPEPPSTSSPRIVYVPSTESKNNTVGSSSPNNPSVPSFSSSVPTATRERNASTYGIG